MVVVHGDRIAAIAHSAPAGRACHRARRRDAPPGLIDCHVTSTPTGTISPPSEPLRRSAADKTLLGLMNAQTYLRRGFTTLRDAGSTDTRTTPSRCAMRSTKGCSTVRGMFVAGVPLVGDGRPRRSERARSRRPDAPRPEHRRHAGRDPDRRPPRPPQRRRLDQADGVRRRDGRPQRLQHAGAFATNRSAPRSRWRTAPGRRVMAHAEGTAGIAAAVKGRRRHDRARNGPRRGDGEADGGARNVARADARDVPARAGDGAHAGAGAGDAREGKGDPRASAAVVRSGAEVPREDGVRPRRRSAVHDARVPGVRERPA